MEVVVTSLVGGVQLISSRMDTLEKGVDERFKVMGEELVNLKKCRRVDAPSLDSASEAGSSTRAPRPRVIRTRVLFQCRWS